MDVSRAQFITVDVDGEECVGIVVRADDKGNEDGSRHVKATVFHDNAWMVWEGPVYNTRGDARTAGEEHGRPTLAYADPDGEVEAQKGSQSPRKTVPPAK